jgi:hypothetical protein
LFKAKISLFPNIPVQIFNVETKQVLVYNSKLIDARAIGVSNSTIRHYIIKKKETSIIGKMGWAVNSIAIGF